jgi:UDP-N-acetylmuramoylalanine--D-glutamate ligase
MNLSGLRTLVIGMEKSGRAAFEFLHAHGAEVTATDLKPHTISNFRLQTDELFDEPWDLIVPSPGVPFDLPPLARAKARGVKVMGEVELAAPYLQGPIIGITGSNGKTTTTSLVGHILRHAKTPVQVGGNIGTPVLAMTATSRADQWNVLELSSFQLETIHDFHADVAVCLNVTQNHLDRHHTFENYAAAKGNLFRTQKPGSFAVLNANDATCRSFQNLIAGQIVWFRGEEIETLMPAADVPIPGSHNAENVMAAAAVAEIAGISKSDIVAAVKSFKAVEHRLEFVAEISGVRFYNDSKATSVDATIKALDSFSGQLWVILGGKDKGSDYRVLRDRLHRKAHAALLVGAAAGKIASQIEGATPLIHSGTIDNAVATAWEQAKPGDTVLLAPACASFDQFQSYEQRGQVFKQLVQHLKQNSNGAASQN